VSAEWVARGLEARWSMRGVIAGAALAVLTSGCATYSWYRADTPPELAAQDEAECHRLARDAARDIAFGAFPLYGPIRPWPHTGWGGWGDQYWGPAGDPLWRMDVEQRIHDRCMRNRGYDLAREPKT
jgi:hypothetical protein